jgi:hypothetical protein
LGLSKESQGKWGRGRGRAVWVSLLCPFLLLESWVTEPDFRRALCMFAKVSGRAGPGNREVALNHAE